MKANTFCTVWSSGTGQTHSPPSNLVMKARNWVPIKDYMVCALLNSDGMEVARRTIIKKIPRFIPPAYRPSTYRQTSEPEAEKDTDMK